MQSPAPTLAPNAANATRQQFITQVPRTIESSELQARIVLREQVAHPQLPNPILEPAAQITDCRGTPSVVVKVIAGCIPC